MALESCLQVFSVLHYCTTKACTCAGSGPAPECASQHKGDLSDGLQCRILSSIFMHFSKTCLLTNKAFFHLFEICYFSNIPPPEMKFDTTKKPHGCVVAFCDFSWLLCLSYSFPQLSPHFLVTEHQTPQVCPFYCRHSVSFLHFIPALDFMLSLLFLQLFFHVNHSFCPLGICFFLTHFISL